MAKFAAFVAFFAMLAGCLPGKGEDFARALFPDLKFERVLASKLRHKGGHGCTYVLLELTADAPKAPPKVVPQWRQHSFEVEGYWKATPIAEKTLLDDRGFCLTGDDYYLDGAGIDGFGPEIMSMISSEGAWFSMYGSGEGQILMVYAANLRRAFHLRFGD